MGHAQSETSFRGASPVAILAMEDMLAKTVAAGSSLTTAENGSGIGMLIYRTLR